MKWRILVLVLILGVLVQRTDAQVESGSNDYQYALIEAVKQKNLGNFPDAIKLYKLVVKDKYECAVAHYELGTIYMMSNQLNTAEMYLGNAYDLEPTNYWYTGGYVEVLVANGKFDEAEKVLKRIIKEGDNEIEYTFQLARLYMVSEEYKKALKLLEEIEEDNGLSEKVTLLKASVYESSGKYDLAKLEIDKVLEYFPESLQFRIVAAELCVKSGNEEEAAKYYEQVFEIDSNNIFAITNLTDYYRKKEDYAKSFYFLERSFKNDQIDRERKLAIMSYYISEEKFVLNNAEELESMVSVYLDKYPEDPDGKLVAVDFYINAKRYDKAFTVLNEYLKVKEAPYGLWMQAVLLANASGMNDSLVEITGEALQNFKDSVDLVFFRSIGLYSLERYEEVINELEAVNFDNFTNVEYSRSAFNLLAESHNQLKNYEEADKLYEMILDESPKDYVAMNNYSYYLAERGQKLEKAKSLSYTAVRNNPDNYTFIDTYAWVLYKLEDYENSDRYIREALSAGGENDPEINEHAGDIQKALGSASLAKKYYEKAIILGGDKDRITGKIESIPNE